MGINLRQLVRREQPASGTLVDFADCKEVVDVPCGRCAVEPCVGESRCELVCQLGSLPLRSPQVDHNVVRRRDHIPKGSFKSDDFTTQPLDLTPATFGAPRQFADFFPSI